MLANRHGHQTDAVTECTRADRANTATDGDGTQLLATIESICADGRHIIRNGHFRQFGTGIKTVLTDCSHRTGDIESGNVEEIERILTDRRHTFGHTECLDVH